MAKPAEAPLGILAGSGSLPREIADHVTAAGRSVVVVALAGESDATCGTHPVKTVRWGQVGALISAFRTAGCRDLVIVGGVNRPDLTRIGLDVGFFKALPAVVRIVRSGGDDSVLRGVVRFFEGEGFRILGPGDVAPILRAPAGTMTDAAPSPRDADDMAAGFAIIDRLGAFDIGQGAIVRDGKLEALEGAEGTDRMLARAAAARDTTITGGMLVKRPKPGQELRVDMPVIGPRTIEGAAKARLAGVAVAAGQVLVAERAATCAAANAARIFLVGVAAADAPRVAARPRAALRLEGSATIPGKPARDAILGAEILAVLAPLATSRACIVLDGYVLAVETGEGIGAALARAASIRPWGRRLVRRRRGALVVATAAYADERILTAAADAGLAVVAMLDGTPAAEAQRSAAARRIALVGVSLAPGGPS